MKKELNGKKSYVIPKIHVISIETTDIIATSDGDDLYHEELD